MDIKFCKCGGILLPKGQGILKCRTCETEVSGQLNDLKMTEEIKQKGIVVLDKDESNLPTTERTCPACKNETAWYWLIQTRASDEPPTQFFRCTSCKHVWREYK